MPEYTASWHREPLRVVVRLGVLGLAVLLTVLFIAAQRQQADVTFGDGPSHAVSVSEPDQPTVSIPTAEHVASMVAATSIVRVDGSEAVFDEAVVLPQLDQHDLRLLLLPPGLTSAQISELELSTDVIVVHGLSASLSPFSAAPTDEVDLVNVFAGRDVTDSVLALIAAVEEDGTHESIARITWRAPTADELTAVVADVTANGIAFTDPQAAFELPAVTGQAFGDEQPVVVVTPYAEPGVPAVDFRAALQGAFPGRPIVQMTGDWVAFAGLDDADTQPVTASFYAHQGDIIARGEHPQQQVLAAMLTQLANFRFSGLFERPTPQPAPDPISFALPWLPWVFAMVALAYVAMLVRDRIAPARRDESTISRANELAALAGLSELAVELSRFELVRRSRHLDRASTLLGVAGTAVERGDHGRLADYVGEIRDELDRAARQAGFEHLRPDSFLPGRWQ